MVVKFYFKKNQVLFWGIFILFSILFVACSKAHDSLEDDVKASIEISASQLFWDISSEGETFEIDMITSHNWEVEVDESSSSWISVSPKRGSAGESTVQISVSANDSDTERCGYVTIKSNNISRDISIRQDGYIVGLYIPNSQLSWNINSGEQTLKVDLTANADWSVEADGSSSSWISVTPSRGEAGNHTLNITVSANKSEERRVGTLTISSGKLSKDIVIIQQGKIFHIEGEGPEDMPIEEWK